MNYDDHFENYVHMIIICVKSSLKKDSIKIYIKSMNCFILFNYITIKINFVSGVVSLHQYFYYQDNKDFYARYLVINVANQSHVQGGIVPHFTFEKQGIVVEKIIKVAFL